jgi:hypothetical protein
MRQFRVNVSGASSLLPIGFAASTTPSSSRQASHCRRSSTLKALGCASRLNAALAVLQIENCKSQIEKELTPLR